MQHETTRTHGPHSTTYKNVWPNAVCAACNTHAHISLGDIQNLPTLWVLALFGSFCNFRFHVQTCRHLGGGMCILFEICKKTPFQKCMGLGGRGCHFSAQHNTWDGAHKHSTAPLIHFYSESLSLSALLFSGRAGTPLGQTSPCLWTGTYFFNFCQSCNLRAFTGTQPSLRGMAHRPSVVRSTFRCLINPTLRQGIASLYPDFSHT